MNTEEIKKFLENKPGYLKEGRKRLRKHLINKGFKVTIKQCEIALREARQNLHTPNLKNNSSAKVLFLDIETSYGLARVWNPGYNLTVKYSDFVKFPKIICISWKWSDSDEVHNVDWGKLQCDKEFLSYFINELNKADFLVGHNIDKFDLPWIRTRAVYHGIDMYPKYKTVDTLKIARYKFKFPSNRLDDLGDYLGVGRKIKTDRSLWVDTVCNGDLKALEKMVTYCDQDVLLLEDVYNKLSTQTLPTIHVGVMNNKHKQTSPYTGNTNFIKIKRTTSKAGTVKYLMKCLDTNKHFEMSNTDYKKHCEINE